MKSGLQEIYYENLLSLASTTHSSQGFLKLYELVNFCDLRQYIDIDIDINSSTNRIYSMVYPPNDSQMVIVIGGKSDFIEVHNFSKSNFDKTELHQECYPSIFKNLLKVSTKKSIKLDTYCSKYKNNIVLIFKTAQGYLYVMNLIPSIINEFIEDVYFVCDFERLYLEKLQKP